MRRCLLISLPAVASGCAPEERREPTVVKLPEGLARPPAKAETVPQLPREAPAKPLATARLRESGPKPKVAPAAPFQPPTPRREPAPPAVTMTSPAPPTVPKADETARRGYKIAGGAALEVEGVCRFDESSVACWNGEGRKDDELTRRVGEGIGQRPESNSLQIRYGMKNRILVVRTTQTPMHNGQGDRRSLSLMEVGSDPRFGSTGYVQMPEETTQWKPGVPQIRREARLFAADKSARRDHDAVMLSEPLPKPAEVKLAVGSRASMEGITFQVRSIGKADPARSGWGGGPGGKMWSVKLHMTGKPRRPTSFYPSAKAMGYVDAGGRLVDQKAYGEWMQKRMEAMSKSGGPADFSDNPYRPIQVSSFGSRGDEMEVVMNVDPKLLGSILMSGNFMRTIDVTGIPLDPR